MQLARHYFYFTPISSLHLVTFPLWLWSCTWRGKMVSVLVEYATLKVFTLVLTQTMSPCNKTRFLELHLINTYLLIFLSTLMRSWWYKHTTLKWHPTMPHMNGSLKNMALRAYQCWAPYPLLAFLPHSHSISCIESGKIQSPSSLSFGLVSSKTWITKVKATLLSHTSGMKLELLQQHARVTVPAAFRAPVPNIAMKWFQMSAEMYANWTLYIAPIVLHGRFKSVQYYRHFMQLVELLKLFLDSNWYRLYYKHDPTWLSACTLTIHALLHIGWGIRAAGPVWIYWAFPMEWHCNTLLQSIRSRHHPYASISLFVIATA